MNDPAILFYPNDFVTGVAFMTDEQIGRYTLALMYQHIKHGKLTEQELLTICKGRDEAVFAKFEQDENGNYYNKRARAEAEKRRKYSESRRRNAKGKETMDEGSEKKPPKDTMPLRKKKFLEEIQANKKNYHKDMLNSFYLFWTELNKSKTKMKFEMQPTWETPKRLATWANREPFIKGGTQAKTSDGKLSYDINKPPATHA